MITPVIKVDEFPPWVVTQVYLFNINSTEVVHDPQEIG